MYVTLTQLPSMLLSVLNIRDSNSTLKKDILSRCDSAVRPYRWVALSGHLPRSLRVLADTTSLCRSNGRQVPDVGFVCLEHDVGQGGPRFPEQPSE